MKPVKPGKLEPGDTVAVVSLSSGLLHAYPEVYQKAARTLSERFDLHVVTSPNALRPDNWLYARPEARADDLHWALEKPDIKGVVSAIGGYESVRILPYLNVELIRKHPKVLLGFSDTTVQHVAFMNAGVVSFHGPSLMAGIATLTAYPYAETSLHKTLFEREAPSRLEPAPGWTEQFLDWNDPEYAAKADTPQPLEPNDGWVWVQGEARAEGHLVGGNIEVLEMLKGTRWWPETEFWKGAILYLETSEEVPPVSNVEYWLRNYASQGILQELSGLLWARPFGYDAAMKERLYAAVRKVLAECGREDLPVVADMDFGHTAPIYDSQPVPRRHRPDRPDGNGARVRGQLASPKKMPISRSAVSAASEPWATFSSMVLAKSPRIVPGAASAGLVAPIILRHSEIAFSPSTIIATTGPLVIKFTRFSKKGLPWCSP